ncbi:MAG: putative toxin-antitoxin system toxin component, PIN family [Myxococcota bacterium]|nr:putative toxin-antitoxin system toxin component, PIN family [Myxococcota bacterium]
MFKVFLDSNVIYSALAQPSGAVALILRMAAEDTIELYVSAQLIDELATILNRPKARRRFGKGYSVPEIREIIDLLSGGFTDLGTVPACGIETGDPKDSHIIDAAVFGQVDYLVSGDKKHILPLDRHPKITAMGIKIISPRQFLETIARELSENG